MSKRTYNVYVLEGKDASGRSLLYVGQTALSVEERKEKHLKRRGYCTKCVIRWDLFAHYNPFLSRKDAERTEKWLARKLRQRGYKVKGGH